jgi:hypothetical protein
MSGNLEVIFGLAIIAMTIIIGGLTIYFNTKFKNIATKEDIGEITRIEGEVRQEFNAALEKVKSQLSLLKEHQFSLATEQRNAIVNLMENYTAWRNSVENYGTREFTPEALAKYDAAVQAAKLNFDVALAKLRLFDDDPNLEEALIDLSLKTATLQSDLSIVFLTNIAIQKEINANITSSRPNSDPDYYTKQYARINLNLRGGNEKRLQIHKEILPILSEVNKLLSIKIKKALGQ